MEGRSHGGAEPRSCKDWLWRGRSHGGVQAGHRWVLPCHASRDYGPALLLHLLGIDVFPIKFTMHALNFKITIGLHPDKIGSFYQFLLLAVVSPSSCNSSGSPITQELHCLEINKLQ